MITGNATKRVAMYLPIDRAGEACTWVTPSQGQTFVGIPYQWHGDQSLPFIEILNADGFVVETVNAMDCHSIQFAKD